MKFEIANLHTIAYSLHRSEIAVVGPRPTLAGIRLELCVRSREAIVATDHISMNSCSLPCTRCLLVRPNSSCPTVATGRRCTIGSRRLSEDRKLSGLFCEVLRTLHLCVLDLALLRVFALRVSRYRRSLLDFP